MSLKQSGESMEISDDSGESMEISDDIGENMEMSNNAGDNFEGSYVEEEDLELNPQQVRSRGILTSTSNFLKNMFFRLSSNFITPRNEPQHLVLLNFSHGSLPVEQYFNKKKEEKYKFVTIQSPVSLVRIIKSAKNACAWADANDDKNYLKNVNNIINKYNGIVNERTFDNITQEIFNHCKNNSKDFKQNYFDEYDPSNKKFERNIFNCTTGRMKLIKNNIGSKIINKEIQIDTKIPTGLIIANDVVVDYPYGNALTVNQPDYQTGTYNNGKVFYRQNTDLLSCPYFILYVSERLGQPPQHIIQSSSSLLDYDPKIKFKNTKKRWYIYESDVDLIYNYFAGIKIAFIDYSCEVFSFIGKDLNDPNYNPSLEEARYMKKLIGTTSVYGGKYRRKKQKKSKRKTRKYKKNKKSKKQRRRRFSKKY